MCNVLLVKHSASRALALLRALNLRPVSSVAELARETGISKPSIVRLLAILMEDGYVARAERPGTYLVTPNVRSLAVGFRQDIAIVRAAGPVMEELTAQYHWPAALGLFEQGTMIVRYSTIPSSPMSWYRTTLNQRLHLLASAMGRLHLAYSPPMVRQYLLAMCLSGDEEAAGDELGNRHEQLAISAIGQDLTAEGWEAKLAAIRDQGYAVRLPVRDHPTLSISVPLLAEQRMLAALSMTFFARTVSVDEAIRSFLPGLTAAAVRIVEGSGMHENR